jgi:hypothetical protein
MRKCVPEGKAPPPRDPKVPLTFDEMWFNADDEIEVRVLYSVESEQTRIIYAGTASAVS